MGWFKYIVGGGLGAMIGGPLGAGIGVWLASGFGDGGTGAYRIGARSQEEAQAIFVTAMFAMLGKICKADGVVSTDEIKAIEDLIEQQLKFGTEERKFAISVFNEAKDNTTEFSEYAKQYFELTGRNRQVAESFLYILALMCWADGELHENEKALLEKAANEFKVYSGELQAIISAAKVARFGDGHTRTLANCYEILGCTESDSNDTVKKKFREMAKKYHPDSMANKGVPEEFIELANTKFHDVKSSYDQVKQARGF